MAVVAGAFVIGLLITSLLASAASAPPCFYAVVVPLFGLTAAVVIVVSWIERQAKRHCEDARSAALADTDDPTEGADDRPPEGTVSLVFEQVSGHLERQLNEVDKLNGRAQQLLTFSGTLLGALIIFRPPEKDVCISVLFAGGIVLFLLVLWTTLRAWAIRGWGRDPNPRGLWDGYQMWPDQLLKVQLILNWILNSRENEIQIHAKTQILKVATALAGAEAAYLAAFMIARPYIS
jgi:hypothetical protein